MEALFQKVQFLKGVGPRRSEMLGKLGIDTVFDLIWYIPRAYFNRNKIDSIASLQENQLSNIRGKVMAVNASRTPRGMRLFKVLIQDDSASIAAVWFNQAFLSRVIKVGVELFLSGKIKSSYGSVEFHVSEYEIIDNSETEQKVMPIYALTEGLNQKAVRNLMSSVLQEYLCDYPDIFSEDFLQKLGLCPIQFAFLNIHFPADGEAYLQARKRLAFEELLLFRLSIIFDHQEASCLDGNIIHREKTGLFQKMKTALPFQLTSAQEKALEDIVANMKAPLQMNRLLQGDVGSGKTVVAALAMALAVDGGHQAAIMAPTEILAAQHYASIGQMFENTPVRIACLTGGSPVAERRVILEASALGEIDILIGTHALIQNDVAFHDLGMIVIDEQHRFGVKQRALLSGKGERPDIMVMTATPIPRSLALTLYGDLDLTVIDELPPGRKSIKTVFIKQNARDKVFSFIRQEIEKGRQAYVVCPLVEESEHQDFQDAVSLHEELRHSVFQDYEVGLLHGRMNAREKDAVMQRFKQNQDQVLVSTTVIEVGVDVPNASTMVIVHAERFGLAQLHQLRGRVGRGEAQSYCILLGQPCTPESVQRLRAMEKSNDGFVLANEDLKIRGAGDFWGVKQHGLNELRVADLLRDKRLIEMISNLSKEEQLQFLEDKTVLKYVNKKFKKSTDIARN
ncbi:MAG: ATP-dependent DNA helicase RecG [Bacillota bacterium]|nr:ATP-dependent DNA helicase RecG [Bacillota bacterium]